MQHPPSKYQQAIFNWVVMGQGNAFIEAVAGAGKTTTLIAISQLVKKSTLFCAFNKNIADQLKSKLNNRIDCRTIHSLGLRCLREFLGKQPELNEKKYQTIASKYVPAISNILNEEYSDLFISWRESLVENEDSPEPELPPDNAIILHNLVELVSFCRMTLTPTTNYLGIEEMANHYGLCPDVKLNLFLPYLHPILQEGIDLTLSNHVIDFTDMIWLPSALNLFPKYRYDFVLVDEAQDLSKAQLEIILKFGRPSSRRFIFVGDTNQAIYGFSGADCNSTNQIIQRTRAECFPLSICYRCPNTHIKLAQNLVPSIEAHPTASDGEVSYIPKSKVPELVLPSDLIVCRRNAPLIEMCIEFIGLRIPAKVLGRDIGKSLISLINRVSKMRGFSYSRFITFLYEYKRLETIRLIKERKTQSVIDSLVDKIKGIVVCFNQFNCQTLEQLCFEISSLFSDNNTPITLATIHKAKGMEANRVFILRPDLLSTTWPTQQPWELQQEKNIQYIALTRAKHSLFFVSSTPPKDTDDSNQSETNKTNTSSTSPQPQPYDVVISPLSFGYGQQKPLKPPKPTS
jgi:superfamily I DNA/RNA helicase